MSYWGKYRAKVLKVDTSKGKLKVKCEEIYGDCESPWCTPCLPFIKIISKSTTGESQGHTHYIHIEKDHTIDLLPKVGDNVWIEFEKGDSHHPVWTGTWL